MLRSRYSFVTLAALILMGLSSALDAAEFDFKDPKGVNAVGILLDSKLEPIRGYADGITGKISYDPSDPTSFKGEVSIEVASVQMSNVKMTEVMHGANWLNLEKFKTITFKFNKVVDVDRDDDELELKVEGVLEAFGVKIPKTVEIEVDLIPDGANARSDMEGDLLVLRSDFKVTRKDLGLRPDVDGSKVANVIEIDVAIVGYEVE